MTQNRNQNHQHASKTTKLDNRHPRMLYKLEEHRAYKNNLKEILEKKSFFDFTRAYRAKKR